MPFFVTMLKGIAKNGIFPPKTVAIIVTIESARSESIPGLIRNICC